MTTAEMATIGMAAYSPLYHALVKGDLGSAKAFLDQHPEALGAEISGIGETALHTAVAHGHVPLVEELVKLMSHKVSDLELKTRSGDTALHIAARGAIIKIAEVLVNTNPNLVRILNGEGHLPVTLAAFSGSREMLDYLYSRTSQEDLRRGESSDSARQQRHADEKKYAPEKPKEPEKRKEPEKPKEREKPKEPEDFKSDMLSDASMSQSSDSARRQRRAEEKKSAPKEPEKKREEQKYMRIDAIMGESSHSARLQRRDAEKKPVPKDLESDMLIDAIKGENYVFAMKLLGRSSECDSSHINKIQKALSALAEMPFAFMSGSELGIIRQWIYNYMVVRPAPVSTIRSDPENPPVASRYLQPSKFKCSKSQLYSVVLCWSRGLMSDVLKLIDFKQEIYQMKKKHIEAHELLRRMCPPKSTSDPIEILVIRKAAECGNAEFVEEALRSNPALLWDSEIFHIAVSGRQERVWNLIYGLSAQRNKIVEKLVNSNNSLLHLAATLPSQRYRQQLLMLRNAQGAAILVQKELQWYKEVEKMVPPSHKYLRNYEGQTPRMLFSMSHYELVKEGEKWMRDTATSCTIVAILVVTVMFASAFTLPGGTDDNSGKPKFLRRNSFMVFITADALSLLSSVTSVLMFLSILTSRYSEEDFLESLPKKLTIGLSTLFLSIATMMVAFGANLYILMEERLRSVVVPVSLLASIPAVLFAFLQLRLFIDMVSSTFGPSIFNKKTKSLFLTKNS